MSATTRRTGRTSEISGHSPSRDVGPSPPPAVGGAGRADAAGDLHSNKTRAGDAREVAGGQTVFRVKPLGSGRGGAERSALGGGGGATNVRWTDRSVSVDGRSFSASRVAPPEVDNATLFEEFMPSRVEGFLDGYNVNVLTYGQTGSGKTHTLFGPPGTMARAAGGEFGTDAHECYGLFPRGMIEVFRRLGDQRERFAGSSAFVLTASAVELSMMGNVDMFVKSGQAKAAVTGKASGFWQAEANGVVIDKAQKPPRLTGMIEVRLDEPADMLKMFRALASRNTAATGSNDSSSRSHCFAWLTLYTHDIATDTVRTNRFNFVDLAGHERLEDAHGGVADWRSGDPRVMEGTMGNFSLMMLSGAVRELRTKQKHARGRKLDVPRTFMIGDLVPLLSPTLVGDAMATCFVTLSQAPANAPMTKNALDFGEEFSDLKIKRRRPKSERRGRILDRVSGQHAKASVAAARGVRGRYAAMRQAQITDAVQLLSVMEEFAPPSEAGDEKAPARR